MEIIENPNPKNPGITTCDKCQCKFSYLESDIHRKSWNNGVYGPGYNSFKEEYVVCPNCGERISVSSEEESTINDEIDYLESILP